MLAQLCKIYIKIRQFFQPYYYSAKLERTIASHQESAIQKETKQTPQVSKPASRTRAGTRTRLIKGKEQKTDSMRLVLTVNEPLLRIAHFRHLPQLNTLWSYTDSKTMQLAGVFEPGAGFTFKNRSGVRRSTLRPKIYPLQDHPFDRTHLIPFGFTRSESDPRLLIGWDSNQNRNELNEFEQKAKRLSIPIIWLTLITHDATGLVWRYRIYRVDNRKLLMSLNLRFDCKYRWLWTD